MRIRKNHSSGAFTHNHKLFSGDMLSFIQVDPWLCVLSLFFFFISRQLLFICIFFFFIAGFVSSRPRDNRFQLLFRAAFASSTSTASIVLQTHLDTATSATGNLKAQL